MTTYNLKITGSLKNVTDSLVGLLEDQNSPLNIAYPSLNFKELNWTTEKMGMSSAKGVMEVDGVVSKMDVAIFRDEYDVAITLKKESVND
jgi:hypothetical protein